MPDSDLVQIQPQPYKSFQHRSQQKAQQQPANDGWQVKISPPRRGAENSRRWDRCPLQQFPENSQRSSGRNSGGQGSAHARTDEAWYIYIYVMLCIFIYSIISVYIYTCVCVCVGAASKWGVLFPSQRTLFGTKKGQTYPCIYNIYILTVFFLSCVGLSHPKYMFSGFLLYVVFQHHFIGKNVSNQKVFHWRLPYR